MDPEEKGKRAEERWLIHCRTKLHLLNRLKQETRIKKRTCDLWDLLDQRAKIPDMARYSLEDQTSYPSLAPAQAHFFGKDASQRLP
jgi:hypothetical protein